jgi:branched-chain amino acid transport system substrate-binding protein
MTPRWHTKVGVGILSALTLAGVSATDVGAGGGDFDDLEPIEAPSPCENDPGVSDTEIKIGAIAPQSGPQAQSFSASLDGVRARFEKANEEGELGTRTVTLVDADDAADDARNLTAAQQLVEQEDVFGVIEVTSAADGGAKYLNRQGVPVTGWHVGIAEWGRFENMFGWRNSQPADVKDVFTTRQADVLKKLGAREIAIVATNVQASATFADQIAKAVNKTKGMETVFKTTDLTPADREFTGLVQEIQQSGADGLYTGMDFLQNTALNAALQQAGVEMKAVVFPGGYDSRTTAIEGMEGVFFGIEFKPFELDPPAFADYQQYMEQADKHFYGQIPYIGWLSADVFIQGIKEAGVECPTREAFINNLRLLKGYDANGAFLPVDFADIFGRPFYCVFYVQVVNEAFEPQFDGEPFCATRLIDHGKVRKLTPEQAEKG